MRCDNEPCTRCIKANAECIRKPRSQAARAKTREKRRLRPSIFEDTDDSSWSNDFSFDSEGNRGWKTPPEHEQSRGIFSSQRSSSAPLSQREPAPHCLKEDPATLYAVRDESRKAADLNTNSHGKPADCTRFIRDSLSVSSVGCKAGLTYGQLKMPCDVQ